MDGLVLGSVLFVLAQTNDIAQVKVDDPMLAPLAPADRTVGNWQDALASIRDRSTELGIARGAVVRAEGASRVALAALLPSINAGGTATYNFIRNTSSQISGVDPVTMLPRFRTVQAPFEGFANGNLTLSQPLIVPRAIWGLGTAHANEEVAHLSESDTRRTVTLNAANAMVGVFRAERVAELNRAGLRSALERLDIATRRGAGGVATGLDVVRAQQDVESARATIVAGDEQVRQARETLGLTLGIPGQVGIGATFSPQQLEDGTHALCKPAPSVEERTDVLVAKEQLVVARRARTDAWLQFSPTVSAQSSISTTTIDTGASPNTTWNIQAILSIPIWDGGARYGVLRDAAGQILQAEQRLEATKRVATVQVTQATRGVEVSIHALEVAKRARDLAAEVDRLVRRAFAEGSGTSLELVTAAAALRQAEINLALSEFDALRARITAALSLASCDY